MNFEQGEIVWVNFNPQKGHEQAGHRPAVVVSKEGYNALSTFILVCPITSNLKEWAWKIPLPKDFSIEGAILTDQMKSIDQKSRNAKPTGHKLPKEVLHEVLARSEVLLF